MPEKSVSRGFVVICDESDSVEQILQNDFSLVREMQTGQLVTGIFDEENLDKVLQFLQEARTIGTAFDWELVARLTGGPLTLHCAAALLENKLLVIGATSRDSALQVVEEMLKINNEQSNNLRLLMKDLHQASEQLKERDQSTYDHLTRLNNQLSAMQRELMKKNYELAELNQQKNYFLGMASHDLRSPLSTILSYSEYLCDDKRNIFSPEDLEMLAVIQRSSNFMLGLINDLLDVAKIESGKLQLHRSVIDFREFMSRNVELNRVLAQKKGVAIRVHLNDTIPANVCWDGPRIDQVMNNLLHNAIKFSYPESDIVVKASRLDSTVMMEVEDCGEGIAPDTLEQLFTPFNMAGKSGTQGEKSTGLGLAIARKIVEGHGGTIKAEPIPQGGTRFVVTLPIGDI